MEEILLRSMGIYKIKHKVLSEILPNKIDSFHIDINTILSSIPSKLFDEYHPCEDEYKYTIASSIINLAAHYRHFFVKKGLNVTIYMYYYENETKNHLVNTNIKAAMKLIEIISKYIDKIYFISIGDNKLDMINAMDYIACKYKHNIILIRGDESYQLIRKNISLLLAYRDTSKVANMKNWCNILLNDDELDTELHPKLSTALISLTAMKNIGKKKAFKMLNKAINEKTIINSYYKNINVLLDEMGIDNKNVSKKFETIDMQSRPFRNSQMIKVDNYIIDKFANEDLRELNTKYFTGFNSLQLEELMMEPSKEHKRQSNSMSW